MVFCIKTKNLMLSDIHLSTGQCGLSRGCFGYCFSDPAGKQIKLKRIGSGNNSPLILKIWI